MKNLIRGYVVFGLFAILLAGAANHASANDNCQHLEALSRQYAGVTLTVDQEKLKRRLVVWYEKNCRERRTAIAN
jgi:hypothetical protein